MTHPPAMLRGSTRAHSRSTTKMRVVTKQHAGVLYSSMRSTAETLEEGAGCGGRVVTKQQADVLYSSMRSTPRGGDKAGEGGGVTKQRI